MATNSRSGPQGRIDEYDDDELTAVLPSPLDAGPVTHAPARSYRPKDVPTSNVYLPEDDFLDDLDLFDEEFAAPAAGAAGVGRGGGQPPPANRTRDRWIALMAGTTTIAALALVFLVAMRLMEREQVPAPGAAPALTAVAPPVAPAPAPAAAPQPATAVAPQPTEAPTLDLEDLERANGADPQVDAQASAEGDPAAQALDFSALASDEPAAAPPPPARQAQPQTVKKSPSPKPASTPKKPSAPVASAEPVKKERPKPATIPKPKPKPKPVAKARPAPEPKPVAKAAGGTGFVTIVCNPACDSVTVGGKDLGPSPVVRSAVAAGPQTVTLKAKGHKAKTIQINVEAGKTTARRVKLSP